MTSKAKGFTLIQPFMPARAIAIPTATESVEIHPFFKAPSEGEMFKLNESQEFSRRLQIALNNAGIPPKPAILSKLFNKCSIDWSVTPHATRKWLMGEAIPTQNRLRILAKILGVTPDWLRFGGEGVVYDPFLMSGANMLEMATLYEQFDEKHQRHIIELLQLLITFKSE